jgi:hypothetical protein
VAIALYRSKARLLPGYMSFRDGNTVLDLLKRLAIVPELVFLDH